MTGKHQIQNLRYGAGEGGVHQVSEIRDICLWLAILFIESQLSNQIGRTCIKQSLCLQIAV